MASQSLARERRSEPRLMCADLVSVSWKEESGRVREAIANIEDISRHGMCLQLDFPIPRNTVVQISAGRDRYAGRVCYALEREIGHYLGIQLEPGYRWSMRKYRPKHLLDPRLLMVQSLIADANGTGQDQ